MAKHKTAGRRSRNHKGSGTPKKKAIGSCLVLTPFKEPFDTYFSSIIKPAVTAARLVVVRGDSLFRPSPIMADIWRMIQDAKVLVADLTEKNANVFYELGLAHAVGKPVVLITDNLGDVPFDLQSLRVIIYDKNDPAWGTQLRASITASIEETLSDPISAIPSMFRKVIKSQAPTETKTDFRLDEIERQVAALVSRERGFGSLRIRSPNELHRRLRDARSHAEALDLVRRGLHSGMPSRLLQDVVRSTIRNSREANSLLVEAGVRSRV